MTIAACSTPRATAPCSTASAASTAARSARAWALLSELRGELDAARRTLDEANRDREWLDFAIGEIDALGVEEGEEQRLSDLRGDMKAAARIEDDLAALDGLFGGSDGGLSQLRQAARRLERIADAHPLLAEALAATDRATIEAAEAEQKIDEARRALAHSPAELDAAEARLFDIRGMARKHRVEADQLAALLVDLQARRAAIDSNEERIDALEAALADARGRLSPRGRRAHRAAQSPPRRGSTRR